MSVKVVVAGSINIDQVETTAKLPQPGETVLGTTFHTYFGGKGANQAVAAARCEAQVYMLGRVGADSFGDSARQNLEGQRVDTRYTSVDPEAPTGVALILVDSAGQNMIAVAPGANARLLPEHIQAASAALLDAQVLVMQLEIPLESVAAAARLAHRQGVKVVLNPAPAQPLPAALLEYVNVLILNERELAMLAGEVDPSAGAARLIEAGPAAIIVTLGGDGALLVEKGRDPLHLAAHRVPVVDTVGAGDAFVGAFAAGLAQGFPPAKAAAWGNAAGALAVTQAGAQTALPHLPEVLALLNQGQENPHFSPLQTRRGP